MSAKKKNYKDKESEKYFREKLEEKLDNLHNMILGRNTPLEEFILTDKGAYSETKTRKFISALMDHIREYRFKHDNISLINAANEGHLSLLRYVPGNEKEIEEVLKKIEKDKKDYLEAAKDKYEAEDIFFENFFYCVIRILSLYKPESSATFSDIAEAAGDLNHVYNDKDALDYETKFTNSDFLSGSIIEQIMAEDEYDLHPGASVSERRFYGIKRFCAGGPINIFHKINNLYYVLKGIGTPLKTDITKYKETDPRHFKLLEKRKDHLENEAYAHKERINNYITREDPSDCYCEEFDEDEIPGNFEVEIPENYDDDYWTYYSDGADQAVSDFGKKFKESDKFIKACELFRYYLNTGKTREFRENHKDDPSVFDLPGYEYYEKKIDYALDSFISDMNLSILSDKDTCVYIYTLLGQAEKIVEKRLGGE